MRVTPAGERDRKITFERAAPARTALGGKAPGSGDWSIVGQAWAKRFDGAGAERREAAVEHAVQTATFNVLSDSTTRSVGAGYRIVDDGQAFDITGIARMGRAEIEFTGTASLDQ